MSSFILGVMTSLAGCVAFAGLAWFFRARLFRRGKAWYQIVKDIQTVYESGYAAQRDIEEECRQSILVRHVSTYNTTFLAETEPRQTALHRLLSERSAGKPRQFQFLHLDPESSFVTVKARELACGEDELRGYITESQECANDQIMRA